MKVTVICVYDPFGSEGPGVGHVACFARVDAWPTTEQQQKSVKSKVEL